MRVKLGFIGTRRMTMVTLVIPAVPDFAEDVGAGEALVPRRNTEYRDLDGLE
jgi:hypothetical protein